MRVSPRANAALRAGRPRSYGCQTTHYKRQWIGDSPAALGSRFLVGWAFADLWIPAFAGMTGESAGMTGESAGMMKRARESTGHVLVKTVIAGNVIAAPPRP